MENDKKEWQELANEYLQKEKKQTNNNNVWDGVSELNQSPEEKLLNTPDLVKLYISKWELYSSSAEKLLNTPDLVKLYISKWGINNSLKRITKQKNDNDTIRS